jgi:hypothetical protein
METVGRLVRVNQYNPPHEEKHSKVVELVEQVESNDSKQSFEVWRLVLP